MKIRVYEEILFYPIDGSQPPVDGAVQTDTMRTEYRTCTLKTARTKPWWDEFARNGTNHREIRRQACRDLPDHVWLIDFEWADLPRLVHKYGDITVEESHEYLEYPWGLQLLRYGH